MASIDFIFKNFKTFVFKLTHQFQSKRLVRSLKEAADYMRAGNLPFCYTSFDTLADFAKYLDDESDKIASSDYSGISKLWDIFAPTCEWDDSGGTPDLGNKLFELLEYFKKQKIGPTIV